jgi:predicted RNA binding protein with dsRBD fold (UPF0201 family)
MKIKIYTPIYPTEDEEKIISSLEKIFPTIKFKKVKNEIVGETQDVDVLKNVKQKILDARILNTVLYLIESNKGNNSSKLMLNKQTLIVGKIHFVEENYPLGNVTIEFDDVDKIISYLSD